MVWNIIRLPSPLSKQEGGGGRWVDGSLPTVPTDLQEPANKLADPANKLAESQARRVTRRVYLELQEPATNADPANKLAEFQAQQVMGDGLLRVAEKRAERRMEPSGEGEGM